MGGFELHDLNLLLSLYNDWRRKLFPHCDFNTFIRMIEKLSNKHELHLYFLKFIKNISLDADVSACADRQDKEKKRKTKNGINDISRTIHSVVKFRDVHNHSTILSNSCEWCDDFIDDRSEEELIKYPNKGLMQVQYANDGSNDDFEDQKKFEPRLSEIEDLIPFGWD